jgi:NAD(P)-dependent dehydrogenase (short-subunit alcohol dehydrogenase family)
MMRRFESRTAFITGAGHGIGKSSAIRLASEGATIVLADLDLDAAASVADEITASFGPAMAVECDVTRTGSVNAAFAAATERFANVDVLVNTAGGATRQQPFVNAADTEWLRDIDLNLLSVMRCVQAALPMLRKSRFGGSVVTIGSVNGIAAFGGYSYSAAKAGLELLTRNLASDYGADRVRFNLVAPGTIRTRVWDHQPGAIERLSKMYPLGRIGEPDDIAAAVAFLASDDAAWITGVTLPVDGGVLTGPSAVLPRNG